MKTEILFPEVANLCGDLMNVTYLRQCCPEMEVVETGLKDRPAFLDGGVDLVYVGSATERGLQLMVKALAPYRAELERYVDGGGLMLATGNALDALGEYVVIDGTYPDDELANPLFRVERGVGRHPGAFAEGFLRGGLMATYLIGPLLPLNPPFTRYLLEQMGAKDVKLAFEDTAMKAYRARVEEFRDEKRGYQY